LSTKAGVGFSKQTESKEAGIEAAKAALSQSGSAKADLVILYSTSKHDPAKLSEGIRSVVGDKARMIGGWSVGIITREHLGYGGYEVGVAIISSDTAKYDLFMQPDLNKNEYAAGEALGNQIRAKDYDENASILMMYDSIKDTKPSLNMATPILEGMGKALGKWPTAAGVGMLGDMQFKLTHQWFDDKIVTQSLMALVFSGQVRMDTTIMHGCKPSGGYHKITKTDGPVVLEIDNRPAVDIVGELLGGSKSWEEYPLFVTLGVNKGGKFDAFKEENYANRLCMGVDKDRKGLIMFEPDLKAGMEVQLMRRSIDFHYMKERIDDLFNGLAGRKPFLALYIDCAGRASAYCNTEREEAEEIQKHVGARVPVLGMYSGVEIAKVGQEMQALDWTGVLCVFSE
jgi:hypothetical protein